MKHSDDMSLFAWVDTGMADNETHGLLADSPLAFADARSVVPWDTLPEESPPYSMTNKGLRIELHLQRLDNNLFAAALECHETTRGGYEAIYLKKLDTGTHQYLRVMCKDLAFVGARGFKDIVQVRQPKVIGGEVVRTRRQYFQLRKNDLAQGLYALVDVLSPETQDVSSHLNPTSQAREWVGSRFPTAFAVVEARRAVAAAMLFRRRTDGATFALILGSSSQYEVGFDVCEAAALSDLKMRGNESSTFHPRSGEAMVSLPADKSIAAHEVRVRLQAYVTSDRKVNMVDISMTALERQVPPATAVDTAINALSETKPLARHRKLWAGMGGSRS